MSTSRSSASRAFNTVGDTPSIASRNARNVSGLSLNSHKIRSAHRRPNKSSKAMIGRPEFEPLTVSPGLGVATFRLSLVQTAPQKAHRLLRY
jgi:hypothetical protein